MNEWEWGLLEDKTPVDRVRIAGGEVRVGDHVRMRPRAGGDVMDIALAGRIATVEAIEQDYEGKFHLAVVVDGDPGRDLGMLRQPAHRFFFDPSEVEPVTPEDEATTNAIRSPSILIACIGNIFMGDDAFGVEVAQRLKLRELPERVRVIDFGIRGLDLAYAILDGNDVTILVDACPRGDRPGTVYVMEPDLNSMDAGQEQSSAVDAHGMDPLNVLRLAKTMGGDLKRILLVGCEPETLGGEEGAMGLSKPVTDAVDEAVRVIDSLVAKILEGGWPVEDSQPHSAKGD